MKTTDPIAPFWQTETSVWVNQLQTSIDGLSETSASQRLLASGRRKKERSDFLKAVLLFIGQFKSPLMLLLLGAVILSAFLGDTSDVFIILFIVLSTGILSFWQEYHAGKVVQLLQSMIALKTTVLRDGKAQDITSSDVVEGDVLLLKAGDMLPADCLLLEANEIHTNEASLTGESFPVRKAVGVLDADTALSERTNCVWEGTSIVSGNGRALVIRTGNQTIFGSIASNASATVQTAFEKGISNFGVFLMKITLSLAAFILVVNLFNHKSMMDAALFALALAVGMAPELLPAITTIAMSAGAKRMLQKKVIVKKLASIQNLGEVNLLCTDKTGTITEGEVKVHAFLNVDGKEDSHVKQLAVWNAQFESGYANPIDTVLKTLANPEDVAVSKTGEIPYDFNRKRISVGINTPQGNLLICKGAFKEVLSVCSSVKMGELETEALGSHQDALMRMNDGYGAQGLRLIAVAYKSVDNNTVTVEDEHDFVFAGFILLNDPVKAGITDTIAQLNQLGVGLKIITGDNLNVARSIAVTIGIPHPAIVTGKEIDKLDAQALANLVQETQLFAEVEPQQKSRIILALKQHFTVAYMGDGINDVSAITAADVGISVDNAVDVARDAADFVLMEKDLMVIVDGIKEGRRTFANTLKYIFINTGSTFGNMFSVAAASFLLPFLPMLPKQILLTNFITDFPYLSVASDNVDEEQLDRPGKWDLPFIRNYMLIFGLHSSLFDVLTFLTLLFVLKVKEATFQTGWFVESILTELFILFIIRTHKNFFKSRPGKYLFLLSVLGLILTLGLPYVPFAGDIGLTPLSSLQLGAMLLLVAGYIVTADLLKVWFFNRRRLETSQ